MHLCAHLTVPRFSRSSNIQSRMPLFVMLRAGAWADVSMPDRRRRLQAVESGGPGSEGGCGAGTCK